MASAILSAAGLSCTADGCTINSKPIGDLYAAAHHGQALYLGDKAPPEANWAPEATGFDNPLPRGAGALVDVHHTGACTYRSAKIDQVHRTAGGELLYDVLYDAADGLETNVPANRVRAPAISKILRCSSDQSKTRRREPKNKGNLEMEQSSYITATYRLQLTDGRDLASLTAADGTLTADGQVVRDAFTVQLQHADAIYEKAAGSHSFRGQMHEPDRERPDLRFDEYGKSNVTWVQDVVVGRQPDGKGGVRGDRKHGKDGAAAWDAALGEQLVREGKATVQFLIHLTSLKEPLSGLTCAVAMLVDREPAGAVRIHDQACTSPTFTTSLRFGKAPNSLYKLPSCQEVCAAVPAARNALDAMKLLPEELAQHSADFHRIDAAVDGQCDGKVDADEIVAHFACGRALVVGDRVVRTTAASAQPPGQRFPGVVTGVHAAGGATAGGGYSAGGAAAAPLCGRVDIRYDYGNGSNYEDGVVVTEVVPACALAPDATIFRAMHANADTNGDGQIDLLE